MTTPYDPQQPASAVPVGPPEGYDPSAMPRLDQPAPHAPTPRPASASSGMTILAVVCVAIILLAWLGGTLVTFLPHDHERLTALTFAAVAVRGFAGIGALIFGLIAARTTSGSILVPGACFGIGAFTLVALAMAQLSTIFTPLLFGGY